jgi:hypothetical protein
MASLRIMILQSSAVFAVEDKECLSTIIGSMASGIIPSPPLASASRIA